MSLSGYREGWIFLGGDTGATFALEDAALFSRGVYKTGLPV